MKKQESASTQQEVDLSRVLSIGVEVCVPEPGHSSAAGDGGRAETAWSLFGCWVPLPEQHPAVGSGGSYTLSHAPSSLLGVTRPTPVYDATSLQALTPSLV